MLNLHLQGEITKSMWKKIKSWFSQQSKEKKEIALASYKPFALVVIGEEMEEELRRMKICDFLSWLRVEDRKMLRMKSNGNKKRN